MTLRLGTNNPTDFGLAGCGLVREKLPWFDSAIRGPKYEQSMTRQIIYLMAIVILGFSLVACEQKKISEINADPGRYMNKEVAVVGRVTQSIGALGKGVYQVDDGTGRLWVMTNSRGVPSKGAKVGVKGYVKPTITFLGVNYATVMEETDRHAE